MSTKHHEQNILKYTLFYSVRALQNTAEDVATYELFYWNGKKM